MNQYDSLDFLLYAFILLDVAFEVVGHLRVLLLQVILLADVLCHEAFHL